MKLLVGLGNPGAKYARHRHNVGFMAVERIAATHGFGPWKKKFQGYAADGEIAGDIYFTDGEGGTTRHRKFSETNFSFGLGAAYAFDAQWSARLEWQRVTDVGKCHHGEHRDCVVHGTPLRFCCDFRHSTGAGARDLQAGGLSVESCGSPAHATEK